MSGGLRVFDGAFLMATLFRPPGASRLIVSFRPRLSEPGLFDEPAPFGRFTRAGWAHLHIQTRWNDWYVNPETEALAAALASLAPDFPKVSGIGFSMGAYACLRFSAALGMTEAVLVSPQFSIHPDVVPFDPRFWSDAENFDPVLGDLARNATPDLRGVLLFDPFRPLDQRNADLIGAVVPQVQLCRLGFGGHPATGVIRDTVKFGAVQDLVLHGRVTRDAVLALHRVNRAASPHWWQGLAERAALTGRHALARVAKSRVIA